MTHTMEKKEMVFSDTYFRSSSVFDNNRIKISYPFVGDEDLHDVIDELKRKSKEFFSSHSSSEIQSSLDIIDKYFSEINNPDIRNLIKLIHLSSGFSIFDIEKYGLGIFTLLNNYDREKRSYYIKQALKTNRIIETDNGYLKRFGPVDFWKKWKEPELLSHFISGNVVGYTAILSRIGMPVFQKGAAQILKLPSVSSFFPLVYLDKLSEIDPGLRNTIACTYWKGGDNSIEETIIKKSDAINVLSSDQVITDLKSRIKRLNPGIRTLMHGHKVGMAYIDTEFVYGAKILNKVLDGLVCDISAFDGGACYTVKNIFVKGDYKQFAEYLFQKMEDHANRLSPVSEQFKPVGKSLYQVLIGDHNVLSTDSGNTFLRIKSEPEFWMPDELYRYVQVMPVENENHVYNIITKHRHYLQTAIIAVPDEKILPVFRLFSRAGLSNIHYPGSAALMHVYEEPHDCEFDFIKIRYNYSGRFSASNFRKNADWLIKG